VKHVWSLVALLLFAVIGRAADRPHVVFVLSDDLGPGDLGCYGGTLAPTPHIDQLAKEGLRFTQFYVVSPVCSPSRCALITGQFPGRWRLTSYLQTKAGNRACEQADFLDPAAPSLPRTLHEAGYKTAHFGKWHLGGGRDVTEAPKFAAYGYDEHAGTWESPEPDPDITAGNWIWSDTDKVKRWQRSQFFVDRTLDFLARNKGTPCFVNVWLDDPHTPWVPDAASDKKDTRANLKPVLVEMDKQVGRLLDGLDRLGIANDTLVIFASDNGPAPTFRGERTGGLRGGKVSLYEGGIRLPFIVRWPGHVPADRTDETTMVAAVDLFPTLCELCRARLPAKYQSDGEDRSAAILGHPTAARTKPLFWEYGRNEKSFAYARGRDRSPNLAIRERNWKLLVNADGSNVELYDLADDPKETKNLAADKLDVAERLKRACLDWRRSLPSVLAANETSAETVRRDIEPQMMSLYLPIPLGVPRVEEQSTGVFMPVNYRAGKSVDFVVFLRGYDVKRPQSASSVAEYWNSPQHPVLKSFLFREEVNKSGKNVVFVVPALGPSSECGKLAAPGGPQEFLGRILDGLWRNGPHAGQAERPRIRHLILAAHSGGGVPLRQMATILGDDPEYMDKLTACWGFDSIYGVKDKDADFWADWAQAHPGTRVTMFYIFTQKDVGKDPKRPVSPDNPADHREPSGTTAPALELERLAKERKLGNVQVVREPEAKHVDVPRAHLAELLRAAAYLDAH
jgi:arylsulfatase A-like enzyme